MDFKRTSPCVAAAAQRIVEATILSGIISYSQGVRLETPSITMVCFWVLNIFILAPHLFRKQHKSSISGSIAAFIIFVVPFAVTAAKIMFSVAPTLGKERKIVAPFKFLSLTLQCSLSPLIFI